MSAYTAAQVEAILGIKQATLQKWVQRGHIKRVGRDLYDEDTLLAHWRERVHLTNR